MPTKTNKPKNKSTKTPPTHKEDSLVIDPIEEAWMNPTEQPKRECDEKGQLVRIISEPVGQELSLRQKRFCELYALDSEFLGNGVQSYLEVYDIDTIKTGWYKTACACSSRLLTNAKVLEQINNLLTEQGLNDQFMDKQILFMASQHADLGTKLGAVKEYNKLKQRITEKIEQKTTVEFDPVNLKRIEKARELLKDVIE